MEQTRAAELAADRRRESEAVSVSTGTDDEQEHAIVWSSGTEN